MFPKIMLAIAWESLHNNLITFCLDKAFNKFCCVVVQRAIMTVCKDDNRNVILTHLINFVSPLSKSLATGLTTLVMHA